MYRFIPIVVGLTAWSPVAEACGGFFCRQDPIDQAGESIVFAYDEPAGEIEAHVQIAYEGSAEEFSWVVPVPSNPTFFVSSEHLFTTLAATTPPLFTLFEQDQGTCASSGDTGWWDSAIADSFSASDTADTASGGQSVIVVQQTQVGPFDVVVLQASIADDLINWLQTNNYQVQTSMTPAIAPYIASGHLLVALRLTNDASVGDLVPLGMVYQSTEPKIPIQLTQIAAVDDMRVDVWLFGQSRAVPLNYDHVDLNAPRLDWTTRGSNYRALLTEAVDEAGGHAWVTDLSASTSQYAGRVLPRDIDVTPLRSISNAFRFVDEVFRLGLPGNQALLDVLTEYVPMPPNVVAQGTTPQQFYNCMRCYVSGPSAITFDPVMAANAIEVELVRPLRRAEALFSDYPWMTRLSTTLSPDEMTLDPVFGFNADVPGVSSVRTATMEYDCNPNITRDEASRVLRAPGHGPLCLPSKEDAPSYLQHIDTLGLPAAGLITRYSTTGLPTVIQDNRGNGYPACEPFVLGTLDPGVAGVSNTLRIRGALPFEQIAVVQGSPGRTAVPGCPGTFVDLDFRRVLFTATANSRGTVNIQVDVPASLAGRPLRMQAVGTQSCEVTRARTTRF